MFRPIVINLLDSLRCDPPFFPKFFSFPFFPVFYDPRFWSTKKKGKLLLTSPFVAVTGSQLDGPREGQGALVRDNGHDLLWPAVWPRGA